MGLQGSLGIGVTVNAFSGDFTYPDRGASQVGNQEINNTILRSYANGLSNRANTGAQIIGNTSNDNGVGDIFNGVGIGVLGLLVSTPHFQDLVQANTAVGNAYCGIQAGGYGSRFIDNAATGNGTGSTGRSDLSDAGPPCPNLWFNNTYGTVASRCETAGGHQITTPPSGSSAHKHRPDPNAPSCGTAPETPTNRSSITAPRHLNVLVGHSLHQQEREGSSRRICAAMRYYNRRIPVCATTDVV